jgi:hypothetical protein
MEHLADKAMKAMFSLQATLKQLGHPPIPVILQLYESMLKPVMCYGSEVWGFNENKKSGEGRATVSEVHPSPTSVCS